jgi:hypothetical protein
MLPLIGYQPSGNFQPQDKRSKPKATKLDPDQQARLDDAIFKTFVEAGDQDFQNLLEVIC